MKKKDTSLEPVYHCDSIKFEKLLEEYNIECNNDFLKNIINEKYCFHMIKTKEGITKTCNRHKKYGDLCERHAKTEQKHGVIYCYYGNCGNKISAKVNNFRMCPKHKTLVLKPLPEPDIEEEMYLHNTIYSYFDDDIFYNYDTKVSKFQKKINYYKNKYQFNFKFNNDFIYDYLKSKRKKVSFNDNITKIIYEHNIYEEENIKPLIPFTPASKLFNYDKSSPLPQLPPQTDDEILLLEFDVVYDKKNNNDNICKICRGDEEKYNKYKREHGLLNSELEIVKSDFEKLKKNKIPYLRYEDIKTNNYVSELMNINYNLKLDIDKLKEKNKLLKQDLDISKLDINYNTTSLSVNSLESIDIKPLKNNEIKMLKNDIYFIKKELNTKNLELQNYKKEYNELMKFIDEKGFKNVFELEKFIDDKKKIDLNNNIEKYKAMYKDILIEKHNINKDIYDIIIYFIYLIKIILNLVDSKTLPITIILKYIKKSFFKTILNYIDKNKNINFEEEQKIITIIYKMYDKTYYNELFDSDGIRRGDEVVTHNWKKT